MAEETTTTETENQVDFSGINYDSVVENCLTPEVKATLPKSWIKFKGKPLDEVFKSHLSAEQELSRRIRIPDENASEVERRKFHTQLGCPESPEGYDFGEIADADPEFVKWAKENFHAEGVSKTKATGIVRRFVEMTSAKVRKQKEVEANALKEAEKDLRSRPGWEGDKYNERLATAQAWYDRLFGKGAAQIFAEKGINTHPMVVANVYALAEQLGEDFFVGGAKGGGKMSGKQLLDQMYPDDKGQPTT